jgi:hypothetical protein
MKQTKLWMLATILTFCGAMAVSLTSCDKDDDTDKYEGPGPLAGMLKGTWYSIYDAYGTAHKGVTHCRKEDITAVCLSCDAYMIVQRLLILVLLFIPLRYRQVKFCQNCRRE